MVKKVADHGIGTSHTLTAGNLKTLETFRYDYDYEYEYKIYHLYLRAHACNVTEERHKIRREKVRSRQPVYYEFLQKLVVNRLTAANFFPPNFVAFLCHVTGMRTKVQMVDFVLVLVVVVVSKGL